MATIIQSRNDTATNWATVNPVLAQGEIGIELDTRKFKVGDGINDWNNLPYFVSGGGAVESVNGQTGVVVLDAEDVGALPDSTVIPTKTSDLTNDSNFATVSQIPTNNNQLTNGAGYITSASLPTKVSDLTNDSGYITSSALTGYATETFVTSQGYITGIDSSDITTALGYVPEQSSTIQNLSATDSITLADNTIYNGGEQTALTITLPSMVDVSFLCEIDFTSSTSPTTLSYSNTIKWAGDDTNNNVFLPVASKRYTIICAYDGVNYRFTVKGVE